MGATNLAATSSSQWLFPLSALHNTPSRATSGIRLEKELYDRSRGVEFLYRLGVSLVLFVQISDTVEKVTDMPIAALPLLCIQQRRGFTVSICDTLWKITTGRSVGTHYMSPLHVTQLPLGRCRILYILGH